MNEPTAMMMARSTVDPTKELATKPMVQVAHGFGQISTDDKEDHRDINTDNR
jgi:hypothetical protein